MIPTPRKLSRIRLLALTLAWTALQNAEALGQEYRVEAIKESPPSALSPRILEMIEDEGRGIVGRDGRSFARIWLRKTIPASGVPNGPREAVQFPFLDDGEFLGVLKYDQEGRDYRDQTIPKGLYTIRYGVQPLMKAHRGVSRFRDFALLVPAASDADLPKLSQGALHEKSAEAAGATHPTCLVMLFPGDPPASVPSMVHDEENATWGVNLPMRLGVKGEKDEVSRTFLLILVGISKAA